MLTCYFPVFCYPPALTESPAEPRAATPGLDGVTANGSRRRRAAAEEIYWAYSGVCQRSLFLLKVRDGPAVPVRLHYLKKLLARFILTTCCLLMVRLFCWISSKTCDTEDELELANRHIVF